jgi:hypothetical protein
MCNVISRIAQLMLPTLFGTLTMTSGACVPVKSSNTDTSSLYAELRAGLGTEGVAVSADLQLGSSIGADVRVTDGDQFVAYADGQMFPMTEASCGSSCVPGVIPPHVAVLPAATASSAIRIAFERTGGTSAPDSTVRLPSVHQITSPAAGTFTAAAPASRSRLPTLTIAWAPVAAEDAVRVDVTGCESNVVRELAPGTATLSFDLRLLTPTVAPAPCDAYFNVTLSRNGTIDPAYGKGGRFLASREQLIVIPTVQ